MDKSSLIELYSISCEDARLDKHPHSGAHWNYPQRRGDVNSGIVLDIAPSSLGKYIDKLLHYVV